MTTKEELLRQLPSIDKLLRMPIVVELIADYGRFLTLEALRITIDEQRTAVLNGATTLPTNDLLAQTARE